MAKKVLLLTKQELRKMVIEELRKLRKMRVSLSEEGLRDYFSKMFNDLLDEYDVEGLVVWSRYGFETIFNEGSFGLFVQTMFNKRSFSELLDQKFLKSVGIREEYSLMERLAMRFGLVGMDEVVRKCKEEDKRSSDDVWCVYSEKGRLLGRAKTKKEALKRLKQVEYFKKRKAKEGK
jgi:hypothetical protein